jgi:hypothetical protein
MMLEKIRIVGAPARPGTLCEERGHSALGLKDYFSITREWRTSMDWNRVEGNWKEFKGKVKEKWGQ